MILTDTEISECLTGGPKTVARMIESAVLAKLAQGVSVEPEQHITSDGVAVGYYSLEQLTTAIAAARVKALEDAAVVCAAQNPTGSVNQEWMQERCADAIRALKGGAA